MLVHFVAPLEGSMYPTFHFCDIICLDSFVSKSLVAEAEVADPPSADEKVLSVWDADPVEQQG